jgi:hypothetical protein
LAVSGITNGSTRTSSRWNPGMPGDLIKDEVLIELTLRAVKD